MDAKTKSMQDFQYAHEEISQERKNKKEDLISSIRKALQANINAA